MGKKLASLIKTAREDAGMTQEQLAEKVQGASKADIGRYERAEAEPTTQVVKEIAKACGVTQKLLLDAMSKPSAKPSAAKPAASKTSSSKTGAKTQSGKTSSSSASSATRSSMRVTATEKRLVELYRAANSDARKRALAILRANDPNAKADAETASLPSVDDVIAGISGLISDVLQKK